MTFDFSDSTGRVVESSWKEALENFMLIRNESWDTLCLCVVWIKRYRGRDIFLERYLSFRAMIMIYIYKYRWIYNGESKKYRCYFYTVAGEVICIC